MRKRVKDKIHKLQDAIYEELADDKLADQEFVAICNELIKYLEDEKVGIEDFFEENAE